MKISYLDLIVLTVKDINRRCHFYQQSLGMTVTTFGEGKVALGFGKQKINLHQKGKEFELKASNTTPGSADFCLTTEIPLTEVDKHLKHCNTEIIERPVKRNGASGPIKSVYIYDPVDNIIEISNQL